MAPRPTDRRPGARRRKLLQSFQNCGANSRFPAPYAQFAGKPLTEASGQGWRYDALGYRNDAHADARPPSETLRVFVVGGWTSYRALFGWLIPCLLIPPFFGEPIFEILFLAYVGCDAGVGNAAPFPVGEAIQF